MHPCLEIVRLRVDPPAVQAFVQGRGLADAALQAFAGFLGSELAEGPDQTWTLIVRWASREHAQRAQAVTLASPGLPAVASWIALASQVVSFDTVDVRHAGFAGPGTGNIDIGRRFASQGLGAADMRVFDELLHPDIVVTTALSPQAPIRGRVAYKQVFAAFADAWPLKAFSIDQVFAAGDKVVVQFTATAVFKKDYYGVPANRVVADLKELHVYTVSAGRIAEILVGAINLPFEFTMYPALKDAVLGGLEIER